MSFLSPRPFVPALAGAILALLACGTPPATTTPAAPVKTTDDLALPEPPPPASAPPATASTAPAGSAAASAAPPEEPPGPCAEGMRFVEGSYCPRVERRCLRKEMNRPNRLEICHEFAKETRCVAPEEKRAFCIDEYEYPNEAGAHPSWMVSWWDAEATCRSKGKRLCYASEWTMACEGPDRTPFPYGWARDQTACNIDNIYINPHLNQMYSSRPETSSRELSRLDQSTASGAMERCVSGYGVRDMTGNFDEWVTRDDVPRASDKGKWAALKGGAWGHVRNACRPMTTSHSPEFTYYFVSFRCCADARGYPAYQPASGAKAPEVKAEDRAPRPVVVDPPGPSKQKVQPERRR
jgi:hypothetical protein